MAPPQRRLLAIRGIFIDGLDVDALRRGQAQRRSRSGIAREGIGHGAGGRRPDAAAHASLPHEGRADDGHEVTPEPRIRGGGIGAIPAGDVEGIAFPDQVAAALRDGLGLAQLSLGGGAVELEEQEPHRQGCGEGQSPEHPEP